MQTEYGMDAKEFVDAKRNLRERLKALEEELNNFLVGDYGVRPKDKSAYAKWVKSHQPFHWFVKFFGIVSNGGFDIIIGNPPYVEYKDVKAIYTLREFETLPCGDLYGYCTERALSLLKTKGQLGLIIPISFFGTDGFESLQRHALRTLDPVWVSFFANRPSQLFNGAQKRLTILIGRRSEAKAPTIFTTSYLRWKKEEFEHLFRTRVHYAPPHPNFSVFPASLEKLGNELEVTAFRRLTVVRDTLAGALSKSTRHRVYYTRKFGYFLAFLDFIPKLIEIKTGYRVPPSELKELAFQTAESVHTVVAALSSSTFFWFWNVLSDCRNLNRRDILAFTVSPENLPKPLKQKMALLGKWHCSANVI
jgi:Eco57I restriction-modification methylase